LRPLSIAPATGIKRRGADDKAPRPFAYPKRSSRGLLDRGGGDLPDEIALGEVLDDDRSIVSASIDGDDDDELYEDAKACVMEAGKASTSYIQRKLKVGYSRAARLIDLLEERGVVGPADGAKPREVLGNSDVSPMNNLSTGDVIDRLNAESEL